MIHYVDYIKDSIGNNYLGIKIQNNTIDKFLEDLKEFLSEEEYKIFTDNQKKRDNGSYHITVINVMEMNKLSNSMGMDKFVSSLQAVFKYDIDDLQMLGIGSAEKSTNKAFFIVCRSEKLDAIRDYYGLEEKDFHITIGFKWKDVFGVRKNVVLDKKNIFIDTLKQKYIEKQNFDFIKELNNFDSNKNSPIIPVRLTDSFLKVKCDGYYLDISYIESFNQLRIVSKYPIEGYGLPRMTSYEINKKLSI